MEKMTKKQAFAKLLTLSQVQAEAELVAFINNEIALLDKRVASKTGKVNEEHSKIKTAILDYLTNAINGATIKEMQANNEFLSQYSNQKLSAILKKLIDNGEVTREKTKTATIFKLA